MAKYVLAIDQGTTSSRAIVFDEGGNMMGVAQQEFPQHYPQNGWVEHDPADIWNSQYQAMLESIARSGINVQDIVAAGITNQRETTLLWDRTTGEPVCNAIVWQCRRTAEACERLKADGYTQMIHEKTGLVVDAYFSGTKLAWMLEHVPGARARAERGELMFGTVDTWLIYKLTGGRLHVTDVTNASRTMMYNIHELCWDEELLQMLNIPREVLPEVVKSCGVLAEMDSSILGVNIPIAGVAGDQHAALFGQTCFAPGEAKNTYGTGGFVLMNTGSEARVSKNGLLTTIAWEMDGGVEYALEGSIFVAGAVIQWLRDELGLIKSAAESEKLAYRVPDTGGVVLVPAFTGLGAPYWDMYSRGTIVGLTRGTSKEHIVRAALESIAHQSCDVLELMAEEAGLPMQRLLVDGGASANGFLMQYQADMLGVNVYRPKCIETTALGAAYMAGLATGVWKDREEIGRMHAIEGVFRPQQGQEKVEAARHLWKRAVDRARSWIEHEQG